MKWTLEEEEMLRLNLSLEELKTLLPGRTSASIISKKAHMKAFRARRKNWSKVEKQTLVDYYDIESFEDLLARFPTRTEGSIRAQASRLRKEGWIFYQGEE